MFWLDFDVAVMVAVPFAIALTFPFVSTVIIFLLLTVQVKSLFVAFSGNTFTVIASSSPTVRFMFVLFNWIDVTAIFVGTTFTVQVSLIDGFDFDVIVIVAVPSFSAVIVPVLSTVATVVLLLFQFTSLFVALFGLKVACISLFSFSLMVISFWSKIIDSTFVLYVDFSTIIFVTAFILGFDFEVAVTVVFPGANPWIIPLLSIDIILLFSLDQVISLSISFILFGS